MIRIEGLEASAGGFTLRDISLDIPRGGYALIIGPTGSGKTTLLDAIAGHVPTRSGKVWISDTDVTGLPPERRGLGIVYQQYHLFPHLTVAENISYGLRNDQASRRPGVQAPNRVSQLSTMLGITHLLDRRIQGLSGGEQQRVSIARALAPRPSVLLLDEPFAAVDPASRAILRRELRALHEAEGITTLQVTHDFDEALRLGNLVAVLSDGRIIQQGPPGEVFRRPNSALVARFIGTGNVIAGRVRRTGDGNGDGRFPARFESGSFALEVIADREGEAHAVIRPEDLMVSLESIPQSVRNRLQGTVRRVEGVGPVSQLEIDVGVPLVVAVTAATVDAMGLRPGMQVRIGLKATAVHLV